MEQAEYLRLVKDVLDSMTVQELKKFILEQSSVRGELERSSFLNALRGCKKSEHTKDSLTHSQRESVENLWDQAKTFMDDWKVRNTGPLYFRFSINEEYDDWSNSDVNELIVHDPFHLSHDFSFMMYLLERALIFRQNDLAEELAVMLCSSDVRDQDGYNTNRKILCLMENNWFVPLDGFAQAIKEVCFLVLNRKQIPAEKRIQRIAPMLVRCENPGYLVSSYARINNFDAEDLDQILIALLKAAEKDPAYQIFRSDRNTVNEFVKTAIMHLSDHQKNSEILLKYLPSYPGLFSYYFRNLTGDWNPVEEISLIQNCLQYLKDSDDIQLAYDLLEKISSRFTEDEASQARYSFSSRPGISAYAKCIRLNPEKFDSDHLSVILSKSGSMEKTVYFLLEGDIKAFRSALMEIKEEPLDTLPLTALLLGYLYKPEKGQSLPDCLTYILDRILIGYMKRMESFRPAADGHRYDFLSDDAEENMQYLLERMRKRLPLTADQCFLLIYTLSCAIREFCKERAYMEGPDRFIEPAAFLAALDLTTRLFSDPALHISSKKAAGDLMEYDPSLWEEVEYWLEEDDS